MRGGRGLAGVVALVALVAGAGGAAAEPAPSPTAPAAQPPLIAGRPAGSSSTGPLIGVAADSGARIVARRWLDLRTVDVTVDSPAIGAELPVRVVVPPGWSQTSAETWPVVLALHGGNDDWTSWTRETDVQRLSERWGVIVAMPEAGRTAAYTDYVRTTPQGPLRWETFHTAELTQLLERGFRAGGERAVIGISGGGYGAMSYAARHRGMFRYAASYSGMLGVNQFPLQQAILAGDTVQGVGTARYGLPILDQANWDAHDPYKQLENLRGTGLYVYAGLTGLPAPHDTVPWDLVQLAEPWIGSMNDAFVDELHKRDIPVTTSFELLGEHDWASWQLELHKSWPAIMQSIGARQL